MDSASMLRIVDQVSRCPRRRLPFLNAECGMLTHTVLRTTLAYCPAVQRKARGLRRLRLALLVCAALSVSPAQAAFEGCLELFPQRQVPQLPKGFAHAVRPLCFDGFAILYSATSKTPVYAVERLRRSDFEGVGKRKRGRDPFYEEGRHPNA